MLLLKNVFCDGKPLMRDKVIPHEAEIITDFKRTHADLLE